MVTKRWRAGPNWKVGAFMYPMMGPWSRRGGELARATTTEAFMDTAVGAMVTKR
jgi:hypothetical protein